ncbi:MAG: hypothetical protein Q4Q53_01390 [Methanocorpusculum sp.]|nr:hypothetical protein [Methanocorpusculum sp.]
MSNSKYEHMLKHLKTAAVILLAALLLSCGVQAAAVENNPQTFHIGTEYTVIYSAAQASDGGYFLSVLYDDKLSVIKTEKGTNKTVWSTDVTGYYSHAISALSDGGCIVLTSAGDDSYLYKLDKNGKISWESPLIGISVGINPIVVSGNTLKLAGWFSDSKTGFTQTYELTNGAPANDQISLPDGIIPVSIIADGDSYVLVGETSAVASSYNSSAWILKMKNGGVVEWKTTIRTECENPEIYGPGSAAFVVCKTDDGGYFVSGTTTPFDKNDINGIIWVAKITTDGTVEWQKDTRGAVPYGCVQIGTNYIVVGEGWSTPFWMTITQSGAIGELNYSEDYQGSFYTLTSVSKNTAAAVGWSTETGELNGYLVELKDPDVKASSPAPVIAVILGISLAAGAAVLFGRKQ